MSADYIALSVVLLIGGAFGVFVLKEAKKYRIRKLIAQSGGLGSSHITPPGRIYEDLGFTPQEIEELEAKDLIRNAEK